VIFEVVARAVALASTEQAALPRASTIAIDVVDVVIDEGAIAPLDELQTAQLLVAWAWRESRWREDAIGGVTEAGGPSYGRGQTKVGAAISVGVDPVAFKRDGRLQLVAMLRYMRARAVECGSLARGLGAYATGKCGGAPLLVAGRLQLAGLW
jgi:hypothetical protein